MPSVEEIEKAIAAHATWKARLKSAIATGTFSMSVDQVRSDTRCDFGRWLYEVAPRSGRGAAKRAEVIRLHAEFHNVASKVVELVLAGKKADAEMMLGLMGPFGAASTKLTAAMIEWKKDLS